MFRDAEYADDGVRIEGFFTNSATLAKYKDIRVKVSFYSVTKTRISSEGYVIYLYTEPNSVTDFSIKIDEVPQAYHSFDFEIVGATPVE